MEEEKNNGLKDEEKSSEKQPDSKEQPNGSEAIKTPEETAEEVADRLLRDGTKADKEIKVNKKSYDDKNEKAKLYEAHAPLLDKVLEDPELVKSLLETKDKGNLDERMDRMEEERKEEKRREIREAVTEAISQWPDFEKSWSEVQPLVESLAKKGLSYKDALRRGYFAVNPEAAASEKERLAKEGVNLMGTFSSNFSHSPKASGFKEETKLSEGEKTIAKVLGRSESEYAGMMEKHKGWLKERGFYKED